MQLPPTVAWQWYRYRDGLPESETQSNVKLVIVSHWADFDKKSGRKTNNSSQQRFFSTDVGMDFSSETVLDIKWGRE